MFFSKRIFIRPTFATSRRDLQIRGLLKSLKCDNLVERADSLVHSQVFAKTSRRFYFMLFRDLVRK